MLYDKDLELCLVYFFSIFIELKNYSTAKLETLMNYILKID